MTISIAAQALLPMRDLSTHPALVLSAVSLAGAAVYRLGSLHRRLGSALAGRRQDARLRDELAAYMPLDLPRSGPSAEFARLLSHRISTCSSFSRAAVLLRNPAGELRLAGSSGVDDLSLQALTRWAAAASFDPAWSSTTPRISGQSFHLTLERRSSPPADAMDALSCPEVTLIPLGSPGNLLGCIALCTEIRSSALPVLSDAPDTGSSPFSELLLPLEALAARLTLQLGTYEATAVAPPPRRYVATTRRGPRHSRPAPADETASTETVQRRTLDRSDAPGPASAAFDLRRLLEQNAPRGVDLPPRITGRMGGFPPSRVWKGSSLPPAVCPL